MTVSRVLGDENHRVSRETRERVLKAVRELEYVPVAQPMTQSRKVETRVVGLVFIGTRFESQWGLPTFVGFREVAEERNYDMLVLTRTYREWMADQTEKLFLDRRTDGLVFVLPEGQNHILEALVKHGLPVVSCYLDDVPSGIPSIALDNAGAMQKAVEHVHAQGHERIMHLTQSHRSDFQARRRGYETAMQQLQLEPQVLEIGAHSPWSEPAATELMESIKKYQPTALVCRNDDAAIFAWDVLQAHGFKIPEDLSIVGMDDLPKAMQRGLTSVEYSCEDAGRRALNAVINLIQGEKVEIERDVVPVQLVKRSSVVPPK